MKLLLTSNGLFNKSIQEAFVGLVNKPVDEIKVAFIPTAAVVVDGDKDWLINDLYRIKKSSGYVDIVDLDQLPKDEWLPRVELADVIFVGGGNQYYLSHCMEKSGFFDELDSFLETKVYAGISAGSMVVTDSLKVSFQALEKFGHLGAGDYDSLGPEGRSLGKAAQLVPFLIRPHLNSPTFPLIREPFLKEVAASLSVPMYAIDDNSAICINEGKVEVISEGDWVLFEPGS